MDLSRLDQERHALELSLSKLKADLRRWQTWEAEYEGLKEEIDANTPELDVTALTHISKTYNGELVNEKEIRDLSGLSQGKSYSASQISGYISRRQEYVQKNIETTQRRFWDAENKLETFDFVASRGDDHDDDDDDQRLLTEISEELDDDDNVVASSVSHPEKSGSQLLDSLKKAGLSDNDLAHKSGDKAAKSPEIKPIKSALATPPLSTSPVSGRQPSIDKNPKANASGDDEPTSDRPSIRKKSVSFTADTKRPSEPIRTDSEDGKKSVSFAEKVAVAPAAPPPDNRSVSFAEKPVEIPVPAPAAASAEVTPETATQKNLRASFKPGEKVYELNDDDELVATHFVLPEGETAEEARARREMIDYNLNEVGHIVAELELEDDDADADDSASASDFTSSEHPDEDTPYTSGLSDTDSDDEEDEYGRSRIHLSKSFHSKMQDLQAKLIGNLGPSSTDVDGSASIDPADARRLVIRDTESPAVSSAPNMERRDSAPKHVTFAEALDVAPNESMTNKSAGPPTSGDSTIVGDAIERRSSLSHSLRRDAPRPTSAVKFAGRLFDSETSHDEEEEAPSGPPGQTIADTLTERPITKKKIAAPSADGSDPVMQRRELAEAYYSRRNNIIRQQGGFKANLDEDDELGELMEERDGKVKKVSRFKAARIRS
jgi:unconventional prefoldin RPB5 interactor 1